MPTLQEYEDLIGKLERLEGFCPATTGCTAPTRRKPRRSSGPSRPRSARSRGRAPTNRTRGSWPDEPRHRPGGLRPNTT
jgi:hypothetical protein